MHIREDDLSGREITALLQAHLDHMYAITPPESVHALGVEALKAPDVTFWSAWEDDELLGCGALKQLDPESGEIKSMRTAMAHRRKGVAAGMLQHILTQARQRGYTWLGLETGSMVEFAPARALYAKYGFEERGPFGHYTLDPNSVYMALRL
ncbi:MAG: GNAT family N-acetyltransferase [Cyanobacteria bacterium J06632_22]